MICLRFGNAFYWFLTLWNLSQGIHFVTDLPSKVRYNVKESFVLTAIEAEIDQTITIQLQISSKHDVPVKFFSHESSHRFTKNFHTFHIPFKMSPAPKECQNKDVGREDFLCPAHLIITITEFPFILWSETVEVDVIKTPRKIHIETDRSVYFPGDEAFVRFTPLSEDLILLREKAMLTIESPAVGETRMISWQKAVSFSKQPYVRKFKIPEDSLLGEWKISATFTSATATDKIFRSGFVVAYVSLPSFKIILEYTRNNVILFHDDDFMLRVLARTFHGKPVTGSVHIRFGLMSPVAEDFVTITHSVNNEQLIDGAVDLKLPVLTLLGEKSLSSISGDKLLVIASVTEFGSGETVTTRDESVIFSQDAYLIEFIKGRQFFHPGVPAIANVRVTYPNGSIAVGVSVKFQITYLNNLGTEIKSQTKSTETCYLGTAMIRAESSPGIHSMNIIASARYTGHNGHTYVTKTSQTLDTESTSSSEYIYIEAPQERLQVDTTAVIQVYLKSSLKQKLIHYNVMKRGKLILQQTSTVGVSDSDVLIHLPILSSMAPSVTLTANYFSPDLQAIVEDRNMLLIEDDCIGEMPSVFVDSANDQIPRPGGQVSLQVVGEPSSIISMIGTDQATKSLKIGEKNEYDELEDVLNSRDESVNFCENNRKYVGTLSYNRISACDERDTARRKRSLIDQSIAPSFIHYAYKFTGGMFDCCIVGARDISDVYRSSKNITCDERQNFIQSSQELCRKTFMKCCKIAKCLRKNDDDIATCKQSYEDAETITHRTVTRTFLNFPQSMKTQSLVEKHPEIRRNNFNPTWFFIDFKMGENGRKMLGNGTMPRVPSLPDRITTWDVDIVSTSIDYPMCVGNSFQLPVDYNVYIDVKVNEEPVMVGTQVTAEVTVYNYMDEEVKAKLYLEGHEGLCSGINPGKNSEPVEHTLAAAVRNIPTTFSRSFVMIPLQSGELKIKFKLLALPTGIVDQVDKVLKVFPEGKLKGGVNWILVDSSHKGYALGRGRQKKKKLSIQIPDDAIPGTEEISMSLYNLPSISLLRTFEITGASTTIQHIFYKLVPAIFRLKFMRKAADENPEKQGQLIDKIDDAHSTLLSYVKSIKQKPQVIVSGPEHQFGFSFSPASNSIPSIMLTSSVLELLYRITPEVKVDENLLRGCLYWILSHQTRQGVFKTSITEAGGIKRKRNAANPNDRLLLSQLGRKVYITSKVLLNLISIKRSLERNQFVDGDDYTKVENAIWKGKLFLKKKINVITRLSKCYNVLPLSSAVYALFSIEGNVKTTTITALRKWKKSSIENKYDTTRVIKWLEVCPYNPLKKTIDNEDVDTNTIEATSHLLNLNILRGFPGDSYANYLLQKMSTDGHWKAYRATLVMMKALGNYIQAKRNDASLQIKLNDPEYNNLTLGGSNTPDDVPQVKLKSSRSEISYSTTGNGQAWIKVESLYRVASTVKSTPVKSSSKMTFERPSSCIYELSIGLQEPSQPFFLPQGRSPQQSRSAWDVHMRVEIDDLYADDDEYESYVVEFVLPVGSTVLENDLEQLFNPVEHVIDHYRLTSKSVILYMTGNKSIKFRITDPYTKDDPMSAKIYPVSAPEKSCTMFYNFPNLQTKIITFCSNSAVASDEICVCAKGKTCPVLRKPKRSSKVTLEKRVSVTCVDKSTFAYKVNIIKKNNIDPHWIQYDGIIKAIFRTADGTDDIQTETTHTFWSKTACKSIGQKKDYLIIGHVVMAASTGNYKHLLDSNALVEQWPSDPGNCHKKDSYQCKTFNKMEEYEYSMNRHSCSNS